LSCASQVTKMGLPLLPILGLSTDTGHLLETVKCGPICVVCGRNDLLSASLNICCFRFPRNNFD
jgi:hypothetical protein